MAIGVEHQAAVQDSGHGRRQKRKGQHPRSTPKFGRLPAPEGPSLYSWGAFARFFKEWPTSIRAPSSCFKVA